jgi:hypothetical protein
MARGERTAEVHNVAERLDLPTEEPEGRVPAHVRAGAWVSGQLLLWTIAGAVCYAALMR